MIISYQLPTVFIKYSPPLSLNLTPLFLLFPPLDNIRVMVIVWRLRGNIIRTALCWIVSHNVHSQQHTYMSSSYRSNRLGLSHWDPYAICRGNYVELYYCNMMEWFWWDSSLISTTNWFPPVLWHCWFGHLACKNRPQNDLCVEWDIKPYTLTNSLLPKWQEWHDNIDFGKHTVEWIYVKTTANWPALTHWLHEYAIN